MKSSWESRGYIQGFISDNPAIILPIIRDNLIFSKFSIFIAIIYFTIISIKYRHKASEMEQKQKPSPRSHRLF